MTRFIAAAFALLISAASVIAASPPDVKGSRDNPLLKRYQGSSILYSQQERYADFAFPLSSAVSRRDSGQVRKVEGEFTRLVYLIPEDRSPLEVMRNYRDEIVDKGGKALFECRDEACRGLLDNLFPRKEVRDTFKNPAYCAINAKKIAGTQSATFEIASSGTHISVFVYNVTDSNEDFGNGREYCIPVQGRTIAMVHIVEPKAREQKMVTVQAGEMASSIASGGKVALYGIHFDSNRAEVKPESDATLEQKAKLLRDNPSLRLLVVGHTDNVGDFQANMELSQRRAAAVATALSSRYGVNRERLLPVGVSFASPVAANGTDEGRAKNRRVELVENTAVGR